MTVTKLHCPFCGQAMADDKGKLQCMSCSVKLPERLSGEMLQHYSAGVAGYGKQLAFKDENRWHCPCCGDAIESVPGYITCTRCGKSLNPFVFRLRKARHK